MPTTIDDVHCIRQAAVTVARRVAEEQGTEVGRGVGYAVRFEERSSPETRIKYLTGEHACRLDAHPLQQSCWVVLAHDEPFVGCSVPDTALENILGISQGRSCIRASPDEPAVPARL